LRIELLLREHRYEFRMPFARPFDLLQPCAAPLHAVRRLERAAHTAGALPDGGLLGLWRFDALSRASRSERYG
jgi:hypothetical protein